MSTPARAARVASDAATSPAQFKMASRSRMLGALYRGLLGVLMPTFAFVAPRWNIRPAEVLPILDNAMARYLTNALSPGQALHDVVGAGGVHGGEGPDRVQGVEEEMRADARFQ